ncbi:hypothetical protein [Planomicrobium okeanokoites]|uniref:Uncharacterized protein n=1 Tax=Planomicrobium okeanokoites TaxID=244 RepID=A0ABV7KNT6_PLAOK|nr:hypothetical protein [Planomicrobium okeanokoites]
MAVGRLLRTAIKYGPIAYPVIRKFMNKKKAKSNAQTNTSQYKTKQTKR